MSTKRTFNNLSQGSSVVVGAWASRIVLKIRYKSFLVYLRTVRAAVGVIAGAVS